MKRKVSLLSLPVILLFLAMSLTAFAYPAAIGLDDQTSETIRTAYFTRLAHGFPYYSYGDIITENERHEGNAGYTAVQFGPPYNPVASGGNAAPGQSDAGGSQGRIDAPYSGSNAVTVPSGQSGQAAGPTGNETSPNSGGKEDLLQYVVSAGDTLYRIAGSFDVPVDDLANLNDIKDPRGLQIGQKLSIPNVSADGWNGPVRQVFTAKLTAYTAGYESTGKTKADPEYGITFTGSKVKEGRTIAVDPSVIPLGSTVYIEGIGLRKAEDTGSAIRGKRIDIYMNDLRAARRFGVKDEVKVYVLDKPDASGQMNF